MGGRWAAGGPRAGLHGEGLIPAPPAMSRWMQTLWGGCLGGMRMWDHPH